MRSANGFSEAAVFEVSAATRSERGGIDTGPVGEPSTELLFSRDDRPVDGQLKQLVVARNGEGLFDASLRTACFDRINGAEVDTTAEIGAGLTRQATS